MTYSRNNYGGKGGKNQSFDGRLDSSSFGGNAQKQKTID